jgi:alkanesulfonate monooxygenase SsuD/methylene tetrahydromethanopterin reductase-like flavin-dependent oxidoreductase (luciferase family)
MIVETSLREFPMPRVAEMARLAEDLAFDGLTFSEARHDPFVVAAVAASVTHRVRLATSVAIAFPRRPMVVAQATHNLQELSVGRFTVGLGTQVRGHTTAGTHSVHSDGETAATGRDRRLSGVRSRTWRRSCYSTSVMISNSTVWLLARPPSRALPFI